MTTVLNDKHVSEDGIDMIGKVCRYCNRADMTQEFQARLLVCRYVDSFYSWRWPFAFGPNFSRTHSPTLSFCHNSRCKDTYYCSKEHQLADWKVHKKVCHPPDRALEKATKGSQDSIMSFVMSNYYDIMKEIVRITQDEGIDKQELVLEIDFFANKGSAPALRDPAEFKIGITSRYLQGDRPDEPDWFYKGTSVYDDNIKMFIAGLTDHYRRMTNDRLLTVTRYASGSSGVYRVLLMTEVGGTPLFSDDALDAFARAMNNDDSRLEQVYGNKSNAITVRRDMEMRDRRMQQVMSRHPDGGTSFLADMARLRESLDAFVASDRYNDLVDNLSEESGDDYDDDEYESAEEEDVDDLS